MLRRTVFAALGVGLAALVILSVVGYALAGLGACIGLVLGIVNIRLVMSTASRLNASGATKDPPTDGDEHPQSASASRR